jgi:hypothetical protein
LYLQCCSATKEARDDEGGGTRGVGISKEFGVVGCSLEFCFVGFFCFFFFGCFLFFGWPPFKSYELLCPLSTINM